MIADVRELTNRRSEFNGKKFKVLELTRFFSYLRTLHAGSFKRITFYFAKDDPRIAQNLEIFDRKTPAIAEDICIEKCGKILERSQRVDTWLQKKNAPSYVLARMNKSEKGVDTQICCDALQLACTNKIDRLFLYTNDADFVPLCKTLKQVGVNISLILLSKSRVNKALVECFDTFDVPNEETLKRCFGVTN